MDPLHDGDGDYFSIVGLFVLVVNFGRHLRAEPRLKDSQGFQEGQEAEFGTARLMSTVPLSSLNPRCQPLNRVTWQDSRTRLSLLLRSDFHRLHDDCYVPVDPDDHRLPVSRRIREEFENGRHYYASEGQEIPVPQTGFAPPDPANLRYHAEQVYRS